MDATQPLSLFQLTNWSVYIKIFFYFNSKTEMMPKRISWKPWKLWKL